MNRARVVLEVSFDPQPLAAASTAQVHTATLSSGESVVVKVRRPDIEVTVKGDLNVIQDVLKIVSNGRVGGWVTRPAAKSA